MGYISRAVRYMSRTNKYEEVPGAEGDDGPGARSRGRKLPKHFTVRMRKGACEAFGATLGNAPTGAVVFTIQEGGVLDRWNEDNPEKAVRPGFVIEKVNGASGYWPVMEALKKSEALAIKIATVPPSSFQEDFVNISKNIEQSENDGAFVLRLPQQGPSSAGERAFATLPSVVASEAGVDECAICLEDIGPAEMLTQLPCQHAFHPLCAARWLTQSDAQCGSQKHSCPLCNRTMVNTGDGVVAVNDDDRRPRRSGPSQSTGRQSSG